MPTPLYTTDVQKIVDRTPKTALLDTDVFVVADEDGTLSPITKPNAKTTLGISDAESAITEMKGTGWNGETVKGNANAINNLVYTDEIEWRLDIELPYLVKYQILYEKTLIGSYNTKLTRFDNELVALWERADIVLTGAPKVYGTSLYCPTASGLIVVSVIDGTDIASYTTYDNCTAVAVDNADLFYTSHLTTNHSKSLVRWVSGIARDTVENGHYHDVIRIIENGPYGVYGVATGSAGYIYAYSDNLTLQATSISLYQLRKVFATEVGTFFACSYHLGGRTVIFDKYLNTINGKLRYISPPYSDYVLELSFSPNGIAYCPIAGIGSLAGCGGINANGQLVEIVPEFLSYNYRNSGLYDGEKYFYALVTGNAGTEDGRTGRYTKMRKLYQRSEI
jgi:hypothetical protein